MTKYTTVLLQRNTKDFGLWSPEVLVCYQKTLGECDAVQQLIYYIEKEGYRNNAYVSNVSPFPIQFLPSSQTEGWCGPIAERVFSLWYILCWKHSHTPHQRVLY